ncbi:hypothetical protein D9613_006585 [Agrocybe pediades]|uniref:Ubiquitin-conjugating enzyme E2 6 n=1 Tax=Agrocybe pediades TaxID=84607 RepID=A0A8H4QHF8_9AGAR|nr:hypothetical protein D9613_006585 [Agrocybe pediades]
MASKAAQKRLSKEYVAMQKEPPPFVWAVPDEKNILTWNFLIRGPPDSPYVGGEYHGVLLFPPEYPFKPPGIKMFTPSGRFQPDRKICFSMSDFHPGTWNPAWSVATILTGLLSFMLSDEMTTGSVNASEPHRRAFAERSHSWNLAQPRFKEAFPDYCTPVMRDLPNMGEKERGKPDGPSEKPTQSRDMPPVQPSAIRQTALAAGAVAYQEAAKDAQETKAAAPVAAVGRHEDSNRAGGVTPGWITAWRSFISEKWRLCAVIALALVVSRFSTRN